MALLYAIQSNGMAYIMQYREPKEIVRYAMKWGKLFFV